MTRFPSACHKDASCETDILCCGVCHDLVFAKLTEDCLDKLSIDDIVAANEAKEAERVKKLGIVSTGTQTSSIAKTNTRTISAAANANRDGKQSDSDKRPAQKVSDKKKEELTKNAAEGKSNISAIANLYKNDDEE